MALLALLAPMAAGECPNINELDVLYDSDTFMCVYVWQGPGDDDAIQACTECEEFGEAHLEDGYSYSQPEGQYYPIGSLITMPGCTFYGFGDYNYAGDVYPYDEGTYPNVGGNYEGDTDHCGTTLTGYPSYKCECIQKMIECDPSDDYVTVLVCDGSEFDTDFSCTYIQTIGTEYTEEASQSMGVSAEVSSEIEVRLRPVLQNK